SMVCISAPANASDAPTNSAISATGSRTCHSTTCMGRARASGSYRPCRTCMADREAGPVKRSIKPASTTNMARPATINQRRRTTRRCARQRSCRAWSSVVAFTSAERACIRLFLLRMQRRPERALLCDWHEPLKDLSLCCGGVHIVEMLRIQPLRDQLQIHDAISAMPHPVHATLLGGADMLQAHPFHDGTKTRLGPIRLHIQAQHKAVATFKVSAPSTDVDLGILGD